MNNLHEQYTSRTKELGDEIARLKLRSRGFVTGEITTFLAFVGFIAAYTVFSWGWWLLLLSALSLVVYIVVRRMDVANSERTARLKALRTVNSHELKYLEGDFSAFDDGSRYTAPHHPFTFDMDIFGRNSLYNRLCRTVTKGGSDYLAGCMRRQYGKTVAVEAGDSQIVIDNIEARRQTVDYVAAMPQWRESFLAEGVGRHIDSRRIIASLSEVHKMDLPSWFLSRFAMACAVAMLVLFYVVVGFSVLGRLPGNIPVMLGVVQLFGCLLLCQGTLKKIGNSVSRLHESTKAYVNIIRLIVEMKSNGEDNGAFPKELSDIEKEIDGALKSFLQIDDILDRLDRRGNILGLIFFDTLLLSDFFLVRCFLRWQRDFMGHIGQWVNAVSRVDAIVSMATFRYNEPEAGTAVIVNADSVVYEAKGLYHPFLGANTVRNDFTIADRNYYIITGANMAGKSTFLRSLGVNYVLALNGMPVFADSLRVSVFSLFTSMRTTDDLTRGISYFNAELLRLKQLIDDCSQNDRTLIILDEILKGTNSADKLNGSRLFLEYISKRNVTGVIATHDLELSKMAEEHPERFHDYCFEIELGTDVTYSYKITPGVARNQNATFLLKNILGEATNRNDGR